jgi:Fic family protein
MEEAIQLSKDTKILSLIDKINNLQNKIDLLKPLSNELHNRIMQKFILDWNYHSNSIEGNSLDYGETVAFIMHGLTAKGKPLKDHLDIRGHNDAIKFLLSIVKDEDFKLTEMDIRGLHETILVEPYDAKAITSNGLPTTKRISIGEYKKQPNHVRTQTGEMHYYATPEETPIKMRELVYWLNEQSKNTDVHPIVISALFHYRFVSIHPFDDGNGRMCRILMNLILMKNGYPPVVIDSSKKNEYYLALSNADSGNRRDFVEYIANALIKSLELYLKGARGESLEEPSDFEKELFLFKKEVEGRDDKIELKRSLEVQANLYEKSISPLINEIKNRFYKLKELFFRFNISILSNKFNLNEWIYLPSMNKNEIDNGIVIIGEKENQIEKFFINVSNLYEKRIIIVFSLDEFKTSNNMFGVEGKLIITLEDYYYKVEYIVSEINEMKSKKIDNNYFLSNNYIVYNKYNLNLEQKDISLISDNIAKTTLDFIKKEYDVKNK